MKLESLGEVKWAAEGLPSESWAKATRMRMGGRQLAASGAAPCASYPIPMPGDLHRASGVPPLKFLARRYADRRPSVRSAASHRDLHRGFGFPGTVVLEMWAGTSAARVRVLQVLSCPSPYPFPFPCTCPCEVLSEFSKGERERDLGSTKCIVALASPAWMCPCTWSGVCQECGEGLLLYLSVWALRCGQGLSTSSASPQRHEEISWVACR